VFDAAGMGGLGQNKFGWALSMRLTVSGIGCGLSVVCGYVSSLMRVYVDLVCGEGNSDGYTGVDSILGNGLLRTEKKDVPC
jgi:hypothetical protein